MMQVSSDTTVKLLIEAPGFYQNIWLRPPACIGDVVFISDSASIKTAVSDPRLVLETWLLYETRLVLAVLWYV